jgi:1-acyl-sn-glycerol-3-phosphate acyltransferase
VENIIRRLELKQGKMPKKAEKFSKLYSFAFGVMGFLYKTLFPVQVHGMENTLLDAPYILISNHNSLMDPLTIGVPIKRYNVRFLGKKELEKNPILKKAFSMVHMIPVDRHNMDMAAVRSCLKVLKENHVLGVFPEGTRHKEGVMQDLESGIAMIALRAKAPLLPAYMSRNIGLFRKVHLYYGAPISVSELAAKGINKENCEELLETIRKTYRDMVAYHEEHYGKGKK